MIDDPQLQLEVSYALRLKMTPSEFRRKSTRWDIVQIAAFDLSQTDEFKKRAEIERDKRASKDMTPEQKAALLMSGL